MSANAPVRCPKCKLAMKLEASVLVDQFYHPDCLKCDGCQKKLDQSCILVDTKTMCKACYTAKHVSKCNRCQKPIEDGKILEVLGKEYHQACPPVCTRCQKSPTDSQYSQTGDNKVICLECFWMNARDERRKLVQQAKPQAKQPQAAKTPVAAK